MTRAAPGVFRRDPKDPPAPRFRKRRELQGPFAEETADAERHLAQDRKLIAIRARAR